MLDNRGKNVESIVQERCSLTVFSPTGWSMENSNVLNFATSLPRTIALRPVPVTQNNLRQVNSLVHKEKNTSTFVVQEGNSDDLERIGQSFRDLSRSVCTDGTEVFGELPSPRLNIRHT